jgi:anti-anti-sigma factor
MISQRLRSQPTMEHVDDVTTITFSVGKIPGEENFIARELVGLTDGLGQGHLFVDLKNVISLVSAELGTLVSLCKKMKAAGGQLTLVNVNPRIGDVFERTRLNKFLDIRSERPPPLLSPSGYTPAEVPACDILA